MYNYISERQDTGIAQCTHTAVASINMDTYIHVDVFGVRSEREIYRRGRALSLQTMHLYILMYTYTSQGSGKQAQLSAHTQGVKQAYISHIYMDIFGIYTIYDKREEGRQDILIAGEEKNRGGSRKCCLALLLGDLLQIQLSGI